MYKSQSYAGISFESLAFPARASAVRSHRCGLDFLGYYFLSSIITFKVQFSSVSKFMVGNNELFAH